jgi:hypothetical protein
MLRSASYRTMAGPIGGTVTMHNAELRLRVEVRAPVRDG